MTPITAVNMTMAMRGVYTSLNPRIFRSHLNGLRSKLKEADNFMNEAYFASLHYLKWLFYCKFKMLFATQ
jgi:uncharacterized MAPEG superfamily protein